MSGVTHPTPWSLAYGQAKKGFSLVANKIRKEEGGISGSAKCFKYFYIRVWGRKRETQNIIWDCLYHLSNLKMKYSDF